jgi:tripartite-type tricarboxylate transporter receptor subunit TctC
MLPIPADGNALRKKVLKAEDAMTLQRRQYLQLVGSAAALAAVSSFAWSQTYPSQPVRLIVGYSAGGTYDILARLIGQRLSERLGQPFVIENRPGAASNIATEAVVRATADGYTLLVAGPANAINATMYDKLNFDFIRDIAPVAGITREPLIMEVHPSLPTKSVPEFIAYAKANPGKINMASPGNGSSGHVAGELFKMMAGVNMVHVPYRGASPALTDLLGGQVQVYFGAAPASIEYVRSGKLRALAVTTATRSQAMPDIPTVGEFVPGYEASAWYGVGAPKSTPMIIVEKLNREINTALGDPNIRAQLAHQGSTVIPGSPAEFGKLLADETEKWGKVIRAANIKPE